MKNGYYSNISNRKMENGCHYQDISIMTHTCSKILGKIYYCEHIKEAEETRTHICIAENGSQGLLRP